MSLPRLLPLLVLLSGADGAVELSVKLVKTAPGRCSAPPSIKLPAGWRLNNQPWHNGENDWEVYFELIGEGSPPPLGEVELVTPGVTAQRVIVGKTDLPFKQNGDRTIANLVDDRSRGQLMQVTWQNPRGGLKIHLIHNWAMRRSWQFLGDPYPARQITAVKNWLLMAQELLRLMGDMGPGAKAYRGDLELMDHEVAATRGHMDWPPHVHIMHYQFERNAAGGNDWVSRLVPHFYLDDQGRLARNSYAVIAGHGKSGELGSGDVCHFEDTAGTPVIDLVLREGGLDLIRPDGTIWKLRPHPAGGDVAVLGYQGEQLVRRVVTQDDPERGEFRYTMESIAAGMVTETVRGGYRYDRFTARVAGPLVE